MPENRFFCSRFPYSVLIKKLTLLGKAIPEGKYQTLNLLDITGSKKVALTVGAIYVGDRNVVCQIPFEKSNNPLKQRELDKRYLPFRDKCRALGFKQACEFHEIIKENGALGLAVIISSEGAVKLFGQTIRNQAVEESKLLTLAL